MQRKFSVGPWKFLLFPGNSLAYAWGTCFIQKPSAQCTCTPADLTIGPYLSKS